MTWRTHVMCGIASLWVLATIPGGLETVSIGVLSVIAAFGALLPDLDASESKVKHLSVGGVQPFALPASGLHRAFGHRGAMHSLMGLGFFGAATLPLIAYCPWSIWAALVLGYFSHLAADACTKSGIPGCGGIRKLHLLPAALRIATGPPEEDIVFTICAMGALFLLLSHFGLR